MFGLRDGDIKFILETVKKYNDIEAVGIYGSRANGNYKHNSDIDIVLYGEKITLYTLSELTELLEEHSPYPYFVDIKVYNNIQDGIFKDEIDDNVKIIYTK